MLVSPAAFAQDALDQEISGVATAGVSPMHEWLLYAAVAMGVLNLVLLYMLYRTPSRHLEVALTADDSGGTASRTDKRMDKRKREIDELRHTVDTLSARVTQDGSGRLNTAQIHDLVKTLVHDELTRTATHGSAAH